MPTAEIYKQAKIERLWIARLRELGNDVFQNILQRILKGDALREISFYCHSVNPQYSPETYRKWLRALERQADGPISRYREQDHAAKAIEEFNKQKAKPDSLVNRLQPEPPSYEVMRRLHRNVNKETKKLNTGKVLQYLWYAGQKRLDRMMDIEDSMGMQLPNGHKSLEVLNKIAGTFLRYELGMAILKRSDGEPIDINGLDPEAQKLTKLDDVDTNLLHNLRQRFVKMMAEESDEPTTGLESNAGTAEATEHTDMPRTDSEPKPSST
jgi:hypothetical protein